MDGVDLNLLVALDVLLAEGSVTAAARRLGLSSSAMSRTLARLRSTLDDPLPRPAPDEDWCRRRALRRFAIMSTK